MKLELLIVLALAALCSCSAPQCRNGLAVFNKTRHVVLQPSVCHEVIPVKALSEQPIVTYANANSSETYLLMLLEYLPNNPDLFILHWLISGIKAQGNTLQTSVGTHDLTQGYFAPVNQTQYEFRLYNITGKSIWDPVNAAEKNFFLPQQWLAKNSIYSIPLAKTVFSIKSSIPDPPGWAIPHPPVGQPPAYPPRHPSQETGVFGQQPPSPTQYLPVYPTQQPSYIPPPHPPQPDRNPPVVPGGSQQPSSYPAQPRYPGQINPNQYPPRQHELTLHVPKQFNINGTMYRVFTHEQTPNNILRINSTMYTSDSYNKRFALTKYLIIDNKSYVWRNQTHVPGKGASVYINGTQYVPFTPPSKEIHHHHYHRNSASPVNLNILFLLISFLLPSFFL